MLLTSDIDSVLFKVVKLPVYASPTKKDKIFAGYCMLDTTTNKVLGQVSDGFTFYSNKVLMEMTKQFAGRVEWDKAYMRNDRNWFHIIGYTANVHYVDNCLIEQGYEIINSYNGQCSPKIMYAFRFQTSWIQTNISAYDFKKQVSLPFDWKYMLEGLSKAEPSDYDSCYPQRMNLIRNKFTNALQQICFYALLSHRWSYTSYELNRKFMAGLFSNCLTNVKGE